MLATISIVGKIHINEDDGGFRTTTYLHFARRGGAWVFWCMAVPDKTTSDDNREPVVVIANAEQTVAEAGNNRPQRCPVCGGLNPGDITHARC